MSHKNILGNAWQVLWRYKTLWLFGFLLALTSTSGWLYILGNDEDDSAYRGLHIRVIPKQGFEINLPALSTGDIPAEITEEWIILPGTKIGIPNITRYINVDMYGVITFTRQNGVEFEMRGYQDWLQVPAQIRTTLVTFLVILVFAVLVLWIIFRVLFYVSATALIRLVDEYAEDGTRRKFWRGLRTGFSRPAWRFFLMDLLIDLPLTVLFIGLFTLAGVPLFLWLTGSPAFGAFGSLSAVGLGALVLFLLIITSIVVNLLKHFFRRACALEDLGVIASIRRGYAVVRQNFKDVGLMWLIISAIYIIWPLTILPLALMLIGVALALGTSLALLAGGLMALVSTSVLLPWIIGGLTGLLTFILTIASPLVFLEGLRAVFVSSVWTFTFRELGPQTKVLPQAVPVSPSAESKNLEADASAAA
jgi:hypothetical protein